MECRECGRSLPPDSRFCSGCGTAVVSTCDECGAELESDARFCRRCGRAVDARSEPGSSREGEDAASGAARETGRERKIATLLFADIVGFTSLGERHDPELVSSRTASLFERLSREVERYEGTIEKFAGDAMLAVFGVPVAHEDDPERAVRAALEMQAVAGSLPPGATDDASLRLRIGIETGEVLVDQTRAATARDLFVTGDAVNTAARLQGIADAGAVVVGASTYAATRDAVDYVELRPVELKGKAVPVAAWRAVAVKAGRGGRRSRLGLQAPLVGRDAELALLKETVRRAVEDRRPHLVTVIGSAGVGKSRLTWELEKYLDGLPDVFHWRKGRCLAYSGPSFGPIAEVVKVDARIADDASPALARERLRARLEELPLGDQESGARDALEAVLAIGDQRDRPRDELFEAWRRYLGAIAEVAPLVLVVEDIHWADDGVLSFLDFLARWGEGAMVIICLARHELLERWSSWGGGLRNATTIMLEPLGPDASSALMDGLLDGGVPRELRARITDLAEGNPLFVEEMVRMLVDRGVLRFSDGHWELVAALDEVQIPGSVQAVLAARLDSLPLEEKRVAQDAAVVGRIFWDVVVAHVARIERGSTDQLIRRLRVKDLVVQRNPSSLAEASEYGFRHVLIRDVAYDSLPKRDRSRLHRDIALWAETELTDRIDEFAELVASHLAAALAYEEEFTEGDGAELGALRELTKVAAARAARRALALSQLPSATRWLKMAVDLSRRTGAPPRETAQLTAEYADVAWETAEPAQQEAALAQAIDELLALDDRSADDDQLVARLRDFRAHALYNLGQVEEARRLAREAIADLESGPPSGARAQLLNRLGWTYWRGGPVDEAVPILERAIEEARASASEKTLGWATHDLGIALAFLGRRDESIELLEQSFRLARQIRDRALLMRCYINIPAVRLGRGDPLQPLADMIEEGLQLARRSAASHTVTWLSGNQAEMMLELGRLEEALSYADEAVYHARIVDSDHLSVKLRSRAGVHALRGEAAAAAEDIAAADEVGGGREPQVAENEPVARAWAKWPEDPHAATELLSVWADAHEDLLATPSELARALARMALRLADRELLARGAHLYELNSVGRTGTVGVAESSWIAGLARSDLRAVADAASTLEDMGVLLRAADAWADAAILAAREGVESEAGARALGLAERMGLSPLAGPLPETRWSAPVASTKDASRRTPS